MHSRDASWALVGGLTLLRECCSGRREHVFFFKDEDEESMSVARWPQGLDDETLAFLDSPASEVTVFAPTNDAFAAASDVLDALAAANDTAAIMEVLRLHVVPAQQVTDLASATNGKLPTLLDGVDLATAPVRDALATVAVAPDGMDSSGGAGSVATVVEPNLPACGPRAALHAINTVLIPPSLAAASSVAQRSALCATAAVLGVLAPMLLV